MSRIGKKIIFIPSGVNITLPEDGEVTVQGPKGELKNTFHSCIVFSFEEKDGKKGITTHILHEDDLNERAQWGTARAILANMIKGVTEGFERKLEINGVGYRAQVLEKNIVLNVGFSHPVPFALPKGIEASVEGNIITLRGIEAQLIGETAARIRNIRKPEPYKGKGIKYVEEVIRRKAGKAAKAGE
ncbi:TPA: 50S ribosomal protein L6 [Candidatus Uhrbacteria bacterium]|uniref:Large ribosomal subunit protein uL6 n=2 Tax=Candidatus Uhriibacteriota TaxID=1752732 RepID=A0A0G1Q8Q8_9BACT|nr:MAG: 50S ribosomal protein L6 [Candidatus Uhrbacteria bacterium GW2011_GWF2_46_218]KKU41197.1 MAG: 50S ribosomal protein L6 [Candidatus Uhrbacteria bacterium GW2011_GWE2_46_68]HBK34045.1 50S ribosomal protein L6 [Candidatus Uhrbacteria bacterium]HCB18877.1 50S ribosomal protein L6 [Candidatus Uhrbacteria bacterium]